MSKDSDSGQIITSSDILLHDAKTALLYEELRAAIDDGHESMTHADALAEIAAIRAENEKLHAELASLSANAGEPTPPVAPPMVGEIALIEKALESVGITSLLNHGAASCVFTEGCCGVSQDHILAYTRKIALHCAVALAAPPTAQAGGWRQIATAPKDGTYLLLWEQYSTNPFVGCWAFGAWTVSHEHVDAEGGWDGANVVDALSMPITHWMPIPTPPTSAEGVEHV